MGKRLDSRRANPAVMQALGGLQVAVNDSGLEPELLELVKIRASQMNGCAWCLDMHSKDAAAAGETMQRMMLVAAWREAPFYTPRERAALEWTEGLTALAGSHGVTDEVYDRAIASFSEAELMALTLAIIAINGWNRINVGFQREAGDYHPPGHAPVTKPT